jgi:hypothetical protein
LLEYEQGRERPQELLYLQGAEGLAETWVTLDKI